MRNRKYNSEGRLMSRKLAGSIIQNPKEAADQVLSIVLDKKVISGDGKEVNLEAQSICIHGDNPASIEILKAIDEALTKNNILKKSFSK